MAEIGKTQTLKAVSAQDFGLYLDAGNLGEILLPRRYVPQGVDVGDELEVFIYLDSDDRLIATTDRPYLQAGEIGVLNCVEVGSYGAFLDWGLPKDLLIPHREMPRDMEKDRSYLVKVYVDTETDRLVASSRLDRHLSKDTSMFTVGEEVDIIVGPTTDMGCKAVVNNHCWGLLFKNEIFQPLKKGQKLTAFIKAIREDDKLDLVLQQPTFAEVKPGMTQLDAVAQGILDKLKEDAGFLPFTDKSNPDEIYETFGVSKKAFKKAIGSLYKQKIINLADDGIELIDD